MIADTDVRRGASPAARPCRSLAGVLAVALAVPPLLAAAAAPLVVAEGGVARAAIVVGRDALPAERHAAGELASFLAQVTGGTFPVVETAPVGRPRLIVGPDAAKAVDPGLPDLALGTDGIVLKTVGTDLVLSGGRPRGTLYAVYTLLEDVVGCRWWSPGVSTIPEKPDLALPALDRRYVPPMEYRLVFWYPCFDEDWSVRNKTHGRIHPPLSEERGGSFLVNNFCHTFFFLVPPAKHFEDHPEWFSEIGGQRVSDKQLCLTNDDMRSEMVKVLRADLERRPAIQHLWVSQNDWGGPCQCANCAAVDEEEGGPSGSMLRFVNAVADAIAEDYPQVKVCTLAYQYTREAPRVTRPRDNVYVWLCDIECNFAQPLDHPSNAWWYGNLADWGKAAPNLYFWEYTANFWALVNPHPNWFTLGPNVKLMAQHGVKGVFAQGAGEGRDAEMAELRAWVLAKLLWNPELDGRALVHQFLDGFYGPAGEHIEACLNVLSDEAEARNFYASYKYSPTGRYSYGPPANADARCLGLPALLRAWEHLARAEAAVTQAPDSLSRVRVAQVPMIRLFLARWDELKGAAFAQESKWPFPEPKSKLKERCAGILADNQRAANGK